MRPSRYSAAVILTCIIPIISGCAKPVLVLYEPSDPQLLKKLALSKHEWEEIQQEYARHQTDADLEIINWGRSRLTDAVEVWCVRKTVRKPAPSGPVFFFQRFEGHWRFMQEMSEWYDKDADGHQSCGLKRITSGTDPRSALFMQAAK